MKKAAAHAEQVRTIRPLPKQLINKIAAGEVVERPASAVKELVENSLDAGANRIDIEIEKSGLRLIRIVDNGCGIPDDQIEIAFSRHATSKISDFGDLESLVSYGFRGEALPSIASVSRLRIVSRTAAEEAGTELVFEGGVLNSRRMISAPVGTTIEVENLFYNTPARRKFLKSDATEARHLSRTSTALALAASHAGFSYTINGRKVFDIANDTDPTDRVAQLLAPGKTFIGVDHSEGSIKIAGYLGLPDMMQSNRTGHYIFVNDRYIQSPSISHALSSGYGELIPRGRYPIGCLSLTIDPREIDVNVHPAKTEVRLSREREIYNVVKHVVAEALRHDGIIPAFATTSFASDGTAGPSVGLPAFDRERYIPGAYSQAAQNSGFVDKLYRSVSIDPDESAPEGVRVDRATGEVLGSHSSGQSDCVRAERTQEAQQASGPAMGFDFIGRFDDLYLLLRSGSDLFIVDQHTAHERVLYEEMLIRVERQSVSSQHLLFPVQVELNPQQFAVFEASSEQLNLSGFTISHFGGQTVNIEAMPAVLSKKSPQSVFEKILDDLSSLQKTGYDLKKAMAQSMACRAAVMAGDRLNEREAVHLVNQLMKCQSPYSCPHGRPTFIRMGRSDIDRQFGRG
ncbi:MAG: DNA mismatch repair endonuclease MutL [Candidatus Zixiibacteriota bacterium]